MTVAASETFYTIRGTMPSTAPSYVKRKADDQLFQALSRGEFCFLLTSRQVGKSSLMTRCAVAMRANKEGAAVVVLDVTSQGENITPQQWYGGLLDQIGEQLRLEDELEKYWREHADAGVLRRWIGAITKVALPALGKRPLVIFVDEVDFTRTLPFPTDEFFAGIRECFNRRTQEPEMSRLTFCLIGSARPIDLMRDIRTTPFNIGQRIDLTDFTLEEAQPLTNGLHRDALLSQELLKQVLHWTGGHPYLTQQLCSAVAADPNVKGPRDVDSICDRLFFSPRGRDNDDNLVFVRDRILRTEEDRAGVLDLYGSVLRGKRVKSEDNNPLIGVLRLAGIVRLIDGHLVVRNAIYRHVFNRNWVDANMPDQEKRRQRAAYRRGLLRLGIPAAIIVAIVSSLAGFAIRSREHAKAALRSEMAAKLLADAATAEASKVLESLYTSNDQILRATELTGMSRATSDLLLSQRNLLKKEVGVGKRDLQLKVASAFDAIGRVQLKLLEMEIGTPDSAYDTFNTEKEIRERALPTARESKDDEWAKFASTLQSMGQADLSPRQTEESDENLKARWQRAGDELHRAQAIRLDQMKANPGVVKYATRMARLYLALGDYVERRGPENLNGTVRSALDWFGSAEKCLDGVKPSTPMAGTDDTDARDLEMTRGAVYERLGLLFAGDEKTGSEARDYLERAARSSACCVDIYRRKNLGERRDVTMVLDAARNELALAKFYFENKAGDRSRCASEIANAAKYLGDRLGASPATSPTNEEPLVVRFPVNLAVRRCRADLFELMARIDAAGLCDADGCMSALETCKRAAQERLVVHQLNPESHAALDALAQCYAQLGFLAYHAKGAREAVMVFDQVSTVYPTDSNRQASQAEAEALLGSGIARQDMGEFIKAQKDLQKAIASFEELERRNPAPAIQKNIEKSLGRARAALAATWEVQNENGSAEKEYAKAIEIQSKIADRDPDLGTAADLVISMARRAAALGAMGRMQECSDLSKAAADRLKQLNPGEGSNPRLDDALFLERVIRAYVDLAGAWKSAKKWEEAYSTLQDAKPLFEAPQRDHSSVSSITTDYERITFTAEINYNLWLSAASSSGKAVLGLTAEQLRSYVDQQRAYRDYPYAQRRDPDNIRILGAYLTVIRFAGLANMRAKNLTTAEPLLSDTLKFREFMTVRYPKDVEVAGDIFDSFTELEGLYEAENKSAEETKRLRDETLAELKSLAGKYSTNSTAKLGAQLALAKFYSQCGDKTQAAETLRAAGECAKKIQHNYPDAFDRWQQFQAQFTTAEKPN